MTTEAWGVTYYPEDATEGIAIINLFATEDLATAYRDDYATLTGRRYGVTRFEIWGSSNWALFLEVPVRAQGTG